MTFKAVECRDCGRLHPEEKVILIISFGGYSNNLLPLCEECVKKRKDKIEARKKMTTWEKFRENLRE